MNIFNTHYSQKTPSKVRKEIQLMINLFRDLLLGTELASLRYFYMLKMSPCNAKKKKKSQIQEIWPWFLLRL